MTQHELAAAAGVSRATIAQLETGCADPRLSTIAYLAAALGISPLVLLTGCGDARRLIAAVGPGGAAGPASPPLLVPPHDAQRLDRLAGSGMQRDRVRAARLGAAVAEATGLIAPAVVTTAVFAAICGAAGARVGPLVGTPLAPQAASDRPTGP